MIIDPAYSFPLTHPVCKFAEVYQTTWDGGLDPTGRQWWFRAYDANHNLLMDTAIVQKSTLGDDDCSRDLAYADICNRYGLPIIVPTPE